MINHPEYLLLFCLPSHYILY